MKKLLLLTVLLSSFAFGQFKEVETTKCEEIGKNGNFVITFQTLEKCNDIYRLTYKDAKFSHVEVYKTITFNDADGLFNLIIEKFKEMPKEDTMLEFEDGTIIIKFKKQLGVKCVTIYHSDLAGVTGSTGLITEKQFHKIFGKKYVKSKKKRKDKK